MLDFGSSGLENVNLSARVFASPQVEPGKSTSTAFIDIYRFRACLPINLSTSVRMLWTHSLTAIPPHSLPLARNEISYLFPTSWTEENQERRG
jgi:hypothetical protein